VQNPFTNGQIKNYLLLYASIVVIMILFFIASTLFNDVQKVEKKVFNTKIKENTKLDKKSKENVIEKNSTSRFKLMDSVY
jgi:predicted Holliday junction resolvase-like endonuclease